ncbi:Ig-like domain repeat protein [Methanobrevibacter sp. DSM 116169]|uniref:Ig-like domain repeat protein n=1 Tax=Methanobrevibacter sp. DSM 116169 TaxID=3242727 RepID=UPI0038FCAE4B
MFINKKMIVNSCLIILLIVISLSTVSALDEINDIHDNNLLNDNYIENDLIKNNGKVVLNQNEITEEDFENINILQDSVKDNFTALQKAINNESNHVINLDGNIQLDNSESGTFNTGIKIERNNIIINGNGYTINGTNLNGNSVRIFNILGTNITIINITLTGGKATDGGAIYNIGNNITLTNVNLIYNIATKQGGAIYNTGDNFKILENSKLENNQAQGTSTNTDGGGAIYNTGNNFIIEGENELRNNNATIQGGAILNLGNDFKILGKNILNNNQAHGTATSTTATDGGGAIYNKGHNFLIEGENELINNTAIAYGGAILNIGNTTKGTGTNFTIKGNNILNYNTAGQGGAIYNTAQNFKILENNELNHNKATLTGTNGGGAIRNTQENFLIDGENELLNNTAQFGGAIFNGNNGLNFTIVGNNTITDNIALTSGGAIYNSACQNFSITGNNQLNNNTAGTQGGAIYNTGTSHNFKIIGNNTFNDNKASSNNADHGGGAIRNAANNFKIIGNNTFKSNSAYDGGALKNSGNDFTIIGNNTFTNNQALYTGTGNTRGGGAIHNTGTGFTISENNYFINNTAKRFGGAVYNRGDNFIINGSNVLIDNNAINGGAIYIYEKNSKIIGNNNFINNTATTSGNTIYNNGNLILSNSTIVGFEHVIYNAGNLFLENNIMNLNKIEVIFNAGTITSSVILTILENKTKYVLPNEMVNITGILTDDNGNIIVNQKVTFKIDSTSLETTNYKDGIYYAPYTANQIGKFIVNGTYVGSNNVTPKIGILEVKNQINLDINTSNITYGDSVKVNITITPNTSGNVTIFINGTNNGTYDLNNGKYQHILNNLDVGKYNITVVYNGNDNYSKANKTVILVVNKKDTEINITVDNITYGDSLEINYNLTDGATGNITITIPETGFEKTYNLTDTIQIPTQSAGNYTITISYNGDKNHKQTINTTKYTINKATPTIQANTSNITYKETAQINITTIPEISGNITITINEIEKGTYNLTSGKYQYTINNLEAGTYNITITYNGNQNYTKTNTTIKLTVNKKDPVFNIDYNNINYKEDLIITITTDNATPNNITIIINNTEYTEKLENGKAVFNISGLKANNYTLNITYNGNNNYNNFTTLEEVNVAKINSYVNITINNITNDGNVSITINTFNDSNGNVTITIANETKIIKLINGTRTISFNNLKSGNYTVYVNYSGDNNYYSSNNSTNIIIKRIAINANNITVYYSNNTEFIVNLTINGNPLVNKTVYITINNVTYNIQTNSKGLAILYIDLKPGNYSVYSIYNETNKLSINNTISILETIIGEDLIKYHKNRTQFIAEFLDRNGNPLVNTTIQYIINGVTYNRTTNSSGLALLNINLDPGKYVLTAINPENGLIKYYNVTVKTNILGENLVKYYQNASKYNVTIFDDIGNPLKNKNVTINIYGMFFTALSNNEGIASFDIDMNPGNYIVTATHPITGLNTSNNITVKSVIYTNDTTMSRDNRTTFNVKVLDSIGNPFENETVTITINGVSYNRTSDSNGIAKLNINLNPGSYTAITFYKGYKTSNIVTVI